jgi:hypothetical protein
MAVIQLTDYPHIVDGAKTGYIAVSLSSLADANPMVISMGSKLEVGGALYSWGADETPANPVSGWASGTQYYIYVNVANIPAPSIYSSTAPTWSTSKQGLYLGLNRCIGSFYYVNAGSWTNKMIYDTAAMVIANSGFQVFSSGTAQTFISPGTNKYKVTCVGGGGGGGDGYNGYGGGGGYGGMSIRWYTLTAGQVCTYTVGAGGSGGPGNGSNGGSGGNTTFSDGTTVVTGTGGGGGPYIISNIGLTSGATSTGTNGHINLYGCPMYSPTYGGPGAGGYHSGAGYGGGSAGNGGLLIIEWSAGISALGTFV